MAPAVAHLHRLVVKNAKVFKAAWQNAAEVVKGRLPASIRPTTAELQPIFARSTPKHPIHRIAQLKQAKGRWYTTHSTISATIRRFTTAAARNAGVKYDRASFPQSRTADAIRRHTGRAPFASTLRPNLTGGTLGRTAGGYGTAGGARYFSHGPAAPAQVINNVSQAVRAFVLEGKKAQFNGIDPRTGEKRFKCVSALQDKVNRTLDKMPKTTPGSFIAFNINPTVTALTPLNAIKGFSSFAQEKDSLNKDGLIDILSVDFSRAVKDLAAVLKDIQRLSALGDLPITYEHSTLKIHFPGCDAETVERICDELNVQRGLIHQDEDFDSFVGTEIALLFPFAPSRTPSECEFFDRDVEERQFHPVVDWRNMMTSSPTSDSDAYSTHSDDGLDFLEDLELESENPWATGTLTPSSPSGYESLSVGSGEVGMDGHSPLEYQGVEGIYRFWGQCSEVR